MLSAFSVCLVLMLNCFGENTPHPQVKWWPQFCRQVDRSINSIILIAISTGWYCNTEKGHLTQIERGVWAVVLETESWRKTGSYPSREGDNGFWHRVYHGQRHQDTRGYSMSRGTTRSIVLLKYKGQGQGGSRVRLDRDQIVEGPCNQCQRLWTLSWEW